MKELKDVLPQGFAGRRTILVAFRGRMARETEEAAGELEFLGRTLRLVVVRTVFLNLRAIHPAWYVGKGQVGALKALAVEEKAGLVLFARDLSPVQHRNIGSELGVELLDRTGLILRIFAEHAKTHEGKVQVELAQLNYLLPRLTGQGVVLSRLGGGVGTRGPGEMKLEVQRRKIKERIHRLTLRIGDMEAHRRLLREGREKKGLPVVSLLGYTNAGKTTLLNRLSRKDDLFAADQLFSTLDPATRMIWLGEGRSCLVNDTVGLLHDLPHHLIAAFRATLDEAAYADVLLCVYDGSALSLERQRQTAADVMDMLGISRKPVVEVFTKLDMVSDVEQSLLRDRFPHAVHLSGKTGAGIEQLKERIREVLDGVAVA